MKKFIQLSLLLSLFLYSIFPTLYAANSFSGSLLWKISGNGLEKPSYLLGTHHFIEVSFLDSIPKINEVIENTEQIVGELDMTEKQSFQNLIFNRSQMPDSITYKTLLSAEDFKRLDKSISDIFGQGKDFMLKVQPWVISVTYSALTYKEVYPLDFEKFIPIDEHLQRIMVEKGKSILGLETAEDQIQALQHEPLKLQAENLLCLLETDKTYIKKLILQLTESYRNKNISELYRLSVLNPDDPCPSSHEAMDAINKDRNDKWLEKLPQIMTDKSSFIVVGALHIAGQEGLLFQLNKMGYIIEPMQ